MGRDTGFEPVNGRFTAGCVSPLHQFRQRHIVYSYRLWEARKIVLRRGLLFVKKRGEANLMPLVAPLWKRFSIKDKKRCLSQEGGAIPRLG